MIQHILDTNPAHIWLREQFEVSLELINGHLIVTRFGLDECAPGGFQWDTDKLREYCGMATLDDIGGSSIVESIADVLNDKMHLEATEVLGHIKVSFVILDALRVQDYVTAYHMTIGLARRLLAYDPRASEVWADWIKETINALMQLMDQDTA